MRSTLVLLLASLVTANPVHVRRQSTQSWNYQGCYQDSQSKRTLAYRAPADKDSTQTVETCTAYCGSHGYSWAGLEYGRECWCDQRLTNATKTPESDCSMKCAGNSSQTCGNGDRLSIYNNGISDSGPTTNPGPPGWTYLACYTDSGSRTLRNSVAISGSGGMTVAACTSACKAGGYTLAGVEYGSECWCDRSIRSPGAVADSGCNMACAGNSSEYCGGSDRVNVYQIADAGTTSPSTPTGWRSLGCYTDDAAARTLQLVEEVQGGAGNMTVDGCLSACAKAGYSYSGLEYAQECWCGNAIRNSGSCATDPSTCYQSCRGNSAQLCGGPNRLNLYYAGSDASIASCKANAASSTTSATVISSTQSTSTATTSRASTTSSSSVSVATDTKTSSTVPTTSSSVPSSSSSTTTSSTTAPTSSSTTTSTTSSSSSITSSSTTTSATPSSTGCPAFWSNVVNDLAPLMRVNGECTDMARAAIRFAFHDAASFSTKLPFYAPAAGGADGSLLLSSTEIDRPDNNGLHTYHGQLKQKLADYKAQGYDLTAADLIQVAGSLGVLACPGGRIGRVLVGRTDTDVAAPDGLMPHAFGAGSDHNTLLQLFVDKGFSARDLAALVGAHSTSKANFETDNGIPAGTPQDSTPGQWDVAYYNETYFPPAGIGRFDSDINLSKNETTRGVGRQFRSFVGNSGAWGASFSSAWQALTLLGVPQSVRSNMRDCSVVVGAVFP